MSLRTRCNHPGNATLVITALALTLALSPAVRGAETFTKAELIAPLPPRDDESGVAALEQQSEVDIDGEHYLIACHFMKVMSGRKGDTLETKPEDWHDTDSIITVARRVQVGPTTERPSTQPNRNGQPAGQDRYEIIARVTAGDPTGAYLNRPLLAKLRIGWAEERILALVSQAIVYGTGCSEGPGGTRVHVLNPESGAVEVAIPWIKQAILNALGDATADEEKHSDCNQLALDGDWLEFDFVYQVRQNPLHVQGRCSLERYKGKNGEIAYRVAIDSFRVSTTQIFVDSDDGADANPADSSAPEEDP